MIKEDKVLISVNLRNKKMFLDKGYDCNDVSIDNHKEIEVNINDVNKTSKVRITAICEICNSENPISVNKYWRNYHRNDKNYYSCFKCKTKELKKTCLERYGVDSYSKTDNFKTNMSEKLKGEFKGGEKTRKTMLERYGTIYYSQSEHYNKIVDLKKSQKTKKEKVVKEKVVKEKPIKTKKEKLIKTKKEKPIKTKKEKVVKEKVVLTEEQKKINRIKGYEKRRKTMLERYGVESYFQTEEMRERNRKWMSSEEFRGKSKETLIEKYGVDSYSKTEDFKNTMINKKEDIVTKMKQTCLERYGVDWISKTEDWYKKYSNKSEEIANKIKQTCLERYGVDNVSKVKSVMKKIMNAKYDNGTSVHSDLLDDWETYKRNVRRLTNKNKSQLYENWNGYDYYDNEYIMENMKLYHTDKSYPTIDHKISVFHGFSNGISEEEISGIDNLCITKRSINSMKNSKIEVDFDI